MEIILASNAGFCFGVRAAINKGEKLIEEGKGPIATLGPLIHNPQEVARLESLGIKSYDDIDSVQEKNVLIRTHGVAPSVYQEIEKHGHSYYDCTCPKVKRVQQLAREHAEAGYQVLVLGDCKHPEVMAIVGWTNDTAIVFISLDELKGLSLEGKKVCLVSQTTEKLERFEKAVEYLESLSLEELVVQNTICTATRDRQSDASELAAKVDLMVVIGGYNSANTCKLVSICQDVGVATKHVETAAELQDEWFEGVNKIGLTAGASTPDWIIREVIDKMEELTMEQGLEQGYGTLEPLNLYEVVTGTVVKINSDEVMVDVGGKSEGVIPIKELSFQKDPDVEEIVKVGDEIQVMVIKMENNEGHMVLSKKRADQEKAMDTLQEKYENGEVIEAKVVSDVKGGVIVDIGARGFVPASHLDTKYVDDIKSFVGNTYRFKIIEFDSNPENRKIILSRRALLEAEEKEAREQLWDKIAEGQILKGRVQRIANFGAFVDLGGVDGLLHISEMGWGRVKQPTDVVNVGDEIEVYVLSADREKGKISLSLKKLINNPWDNAAEQFPVGAVLTGKVVRIAPFGAFVALADGVDGLVHISQISWEHIDKVEDALAIGQEVQVKVLEVDEDRKRISLSIKDLKERPVVEKPAAPAKPKKQAKPKSDVPEVNEELSNDAFASLADLLGEN
ncbi:MAG: bifunctional 4-hydroxy-3-methylbut-2-enyl diphosphate reductase/30S ribosomal protein S1 [Peptococcaceae bacterium]|jgi:small subunit ribosomal protein S1|nr:bifunctional 4-hydroxy-3-methylbut-2-enyl diphosphate reductase/30S ribosomal protein S1 [Peptococcaceae bacterium]